MSRLQEHYTKTGIESLKKTFGYKNPHQVPKLEKIVVNCVSRDVVANSKVYESISSDLALITGQKPVTAKAKKSISSFKLRQGQVIGGFVTLRGSRMYEFLDRLITFSLPRVRDFRGISPKGFDGKGNYTLGLKEQIIFPEINYDRIDKIRGFGITFVTTAKNNNEGRELLRVLGMPFREK